MVSGTPNCTHVACLHAESSYIYCTQHVLHSISVFDSELCAHRNILGMLIHRCDITNAHKAQKQVEIMGLITEVCILLSEKQGQQLQLTSHSDTSSTVQEWTVS